MKTPLLPLLLALSLLPFSAPAQEPLLGSAEIEQVVTDEQTDVTSAEPSEFVDYSTEFPSTRQNERLERLPFSPFRHPLINNQYNARTASAILAETKAIEKRVLDRYKREKIGSVQGYYEYWGSSLDAEIIDRLVEAKWEGKAGEHHYLTGGPDQFRSLRLEARNKHVSASPTVLSYRQIRVTKPIDRFEETTENRFDGLMHAKLKVGRLECQRIIVAPAFELRPEHALGDSDTPRWERITPASHYDECKLTGPASKEADKAIFDALEKGPANDIRVASNVVQRKAGRLSCARVSSGGNATYECSLDEKYVPR